MERGRKRRERNPGERRPDDDEEGALRSNRVPETSDESDDGGE
ncbi:hypothetical protein [Natronococcus occultus]|nr:hypothetical protein [Natronococcus occultus]